MTPSDLPPFWLGLMGVPYGFGVLAPEPINPLRLAQLFPGLDTAGFGFVPPQEWKPWLKPGDLDVDKEIANAIASGKLRARDHLRARGIVCPYYSARYFVARAAMSADADKKRAEIALNKQVPRLEEASALALAQKKGLDELLMRLEDSPDDWSPLPFRVGSVDGNDILLDASGRPAKGSFASRLNFQAARAQVENAETAYRDLLARLKAVVREALPVLEDVRQISNGLAEEIRNIHKSIPGVSKDKKGDGRPPDVWVYTFIIELAYAWYALTGENTQTGKAFVAFIDAAYCCVRPKETKKQLSQIRSAVKAINKRPEWDNLNRIDKFAPPPGAQDIEYETYQILSMRRDLIKKRLAKNLIIAWRRGDKAALPSLRAVRDMALGTGSKALLDFIRGHLTPDELREFESQPD